MFLKQSRAGFISVLFLPFFILMMTGVVGLSVLSVGIKNITRLQSYCMKINLEGQNSQRRILEEILKLNNKVLFLHKTRKTLETSLIAATSLKLGPVVLSLKKKLNKIQQIQRSLIVKQKHLLSQSLWVKRRTFKKFKEKIKRFKVSYVWDQTLYKPALAIRRKKEGSEAYTYKPVPDFTNHQKSHFSWKVDPFFPLRLSYRWWGINFQNKGTHLLDYSCVASLRKKGKIWENILYH